MKDLETIERLPHASYITRSWCAPHMMRSKRPMINDLSVVYNVSISGKRRKKEEEDKKKKKKKKKKNHLQMKVRTPLLNENRYE